jgi:hypothetical protein
MGVFKPAATVTGLYREDAGYNPTAAAFNPYRDVWRDMHSALSVASNTDDSYEARIVIKKKGKD